MSSHLPLGRLARHEDSSLSSCVSAGAQVGTVSAMTWPFLTAIDAVERELHRLAEVGRELLDRRLAHHAVEQALAAAQDRQAAPTDSPKLPLKKSIWRLSGLPREIVHATILPSAGTMYVARLLTTLAW